jgi:iron uptake system component EfeO
MKYRSFLALVIASGALGACSSDSSQSSGPATPQTDAEWRADVTTKMHGTLAAEIDTLVGAAQAIARAAPAHAWNAEADREAIASMRASWVEARVAYEHVEGALAPLFPEIDAAIDARYEDFLDELGGKGDGDPFDGQGVTGMHAIERILWAPEIPGYVKDHEEKELASKGYRPAAFPATDDEAARFKTQLVQRLVDDASRLRDQWKPQKIDVAGAFTGLIALMNEQLEKVNKASSSEEESRYSQRTMADIRANLDGTKTIYALFQPWLRTKSSEADARVVAGFDRLRVAYDAVKGEAIPRPPATWKAEEPDDNTADDRGSDFGKLFFSVRDAVDVRKSESVIAAMNGGAEKMGLAEAQAAK